MYYDDHDTEGFIYVKSPSNRFTSKYILYVQDEATLESEIRISTRDSATLDSSIAVRRNSKSELSNVINVMYRGNGDLHSSILAMSVTEVHSSINVRPHNRAQGAYELMEAPRVTANLQPIADATTRSRIDLQTINYGDTQRMMIGYSDTENFESFVNFGDLKSAIPDLLNIESAKLRLYYTGTIGNNANIELHQPNTLWYEYGITYANKPSSVELLSNTYTINAQSKYIEFDVLDIVKSWQDKTLFNYGLIIKSSDNQPIYINTRESVKPPILEVRYITSQVRSYGRSEIDSTLFVYKKKPKDLGSYIIVKSYGGTKTLASTIYIHRYEDPLYEDFDSYISVNRAEINSWITITIPDDATLDSSITIIESSVVDLWSTASVTRPDLSSHITVDPNMSLKSYIDITNRDTKDAYSQIAISKPDLTGFIMVSDYTRTNHDIDSEVFVRREYVAESDGYINVSRPESSGYINVRAIDDHDVSAYIDVPSFEYFESHITVSHPDMNSFIDVKSVGESTIDSWLYIKDKEYLDSIIDVRQISDLTSTILIKKFSEIKSEITISKPDLGGYIYPRVGGLHDTSAIIDIRKRDVADLSSTIIIRGVSSGAYYYIL
nr:DNRLRE domain-containing protein [Paenibacillus xylanexedens]